MISSLAISATIQIISQVCHFHLVDSTGVIAAVKHNSWVTRAPCSLYARYLSTTICCSPLLLYILVLNFLGYRSVIRHICPYDSACYNFRVRPAGMLARLTCQGCWSVTAGLRAQPERKVLRTGSFSSYAQELSYSGNYCNGRPNWWTIERFSCRVVFSWPGIGRFLSSISARDLWSRQQCYCQP